jgi:hypothetical protein
MSSDVTWRSPSNATLSHRTTWVSRVIRAENLNEIPIKTWDRRATALFIIDFN